MKIGDLFVKLGLKKDDFSKGMKEADKETKTFAGAMKSMSAIGAAAWAAVSAAVVKFATDAVKMTQRWGDAWNNTMAGVKQAYGTFVRQLSSGAGWDNLFQNMAEAYRRGKEVAAVLDEIFERKISYSYQEAATEKEVEEWRAIMQDQSKSDAQRKEAANKIIQLEEKLGQVKKGIYADEAAAMRENFKIASGLQNDQDIDFLVKEYNKNREVINQAREYLRLKKEYSTTTGGNDFFTRTAGAGRSNKVDPRLAKLESETPQYIKDVAELTKGYDRANDELVKGMAEAEVAAIKVDTQVLQAQRRAKQTLGSLNAKKGGSSGKSEEELQMEQAQRIQERARESAKSELQILTEKYTQERALLQAFGMDVEALSAEYQKNVTRLLDVPLEKMQELDDMVVDLDIELDDDPVEEFISKYEGDLQRMQDLLADLRDAAIAGLSDAIQELADQFMGLSEINPGKVVQALLTPLADMAIKEGEILIAQGIGVEACKKALESLNGYAAIAAGTTLLLIGAAAKSGLAALARSGGSSTATTSYSSSGSSTAQTQTIQTEMTVYVTGRLSGSDILLSGQKTQNQWNR
jgi:hypothetical protein